MSQTELSHVKHFWEVASHFDTGMLVTLANGHEFHARPMRILQATENDGIWLISNKMAPKCLEILDNSTISLTFQGIDRYLALTGQSRLIKDSTKVHDLWSERFKLWFPEGKYDPNIILIQVIPVGGEYWDYSGIGKKMKFAWETSKSYVKGTKVDGEKLGEHAKVDLVHDIRK